MTKIPSLALAILGLFVVPAMALEVSTVATVPGTPKEVWNRIGSFCSIKNWHPVIAKCEKSKESGTTYRTLTTKDGGTIKEKLTGTEETGYSYEILESPLPVKNYKATLKVGEDDEEGRVEIVWQATFDAEGASDDDAKKKIADVFDAGVSGIKEKANTAHYGSDESKVTPKGDDK